MIPVCPDDLAAVEGPGGAGGGGKCVKVGMGSRVGAEPGRCWGGRSPITWTEEGSLLESRRQMVSCRDGQN